jgi:hypothetical protein
MQIEVSVTYDAKRGYIASAPELREPVVALSLGGLRSKIEALMSPARAGIILQLDGLAERERHRRQAAPTPSSEHPVAANRLRTEFGPRGGQTHRVDRLWLLTWTASFGARSLPTFPCRRRPSTSW